MAAGGTETALVVLPKPEIEIDPIEAEYLAVKNANMREEPTVRSAKVAALKRGAQVHVAGKVKDRNWYLVEREDKPLGYVFGALLKEPEAAKLVLAVPPKPPPGAVQPAVPAALVSQVSPSFAGSCVWPCPPDSPPLG